MNSDQEEAVITWRNVAKFFPKSVHTVKTKYGPEMLRLGVVMKDRIGRTKKTIVFGFPSVIKRYVMEKAKRGEL